MDQEASQASVRRRLQRTLEAEGVDRQRRAAITITVALGICAPLIAVLSGLPQAFYYHALILLFIAAAWLQYFCVRRRPNSLWIDYVFVVVSFALLSFTLIYPNPFSEISDYVYAPSLGLRFDNFIFFFLILGGLALSFSPWLVIWGGVCGAAFWSLGRLWVISHPQIDVFDPAVHAPEATSFGAVIEMALQPQFVDPGIWFQEVIVFLIVSGLLALVVQGSRELLLRRAMEERRGANLARYLPPQLAEQMAETDTPFLEDREAEAAVLFTDVVGFTHWAETRSPQEVMATLREVHALVAEEVFRAEGVLDKFIGDGAMATFGAANSSEAAGRRALECVEAIVARMEAFNAQQTGQGQKPVRLSLGAHYGPVTIGDVGTKGRLEMAVLGDAVNVASRLEELTRSLNVDAVASDALMTAAGGAPQHWATGGAHTLRGRTGTVGVWTFRAGA